MSQTCNHCKSRDALTANYWQQGAGNFVFCADCAVLFGFSPRPPDVPSQVVEQDFTEILGEEAVDKLPNDFIRNDGNVEVGMPIGSLFGACPKHGVIHANGAGCPSKQK